MRNKKKIIIITLVFSKQEKRCDIIPMLHSFVWNWEFFNFYLFASIPYRLLVIDGLSPLTSVPGLKRKRKKKKKKGKKGWEYWATLFTWQLVKRRGHASFIHEIIGAGQVSIKSDGWRASWAGYIGRRRPSGSWSRGDIWSIKNMERPYSPFVTLFCTCLA